MTDIKMPDLNNVIIAGNLTKDPVIRNTTNGTPVANFTIACNRKFKDNVGQWREDVCYIGVVAWYKLAETCKENLLRGSAVIVDGELQSRSWKTENGHFRNIVEIKARRIQFLNKKETSEDLTDLVVQDEPQDETIPEEEKDLNQEKEESIETETDKSENKEDEKFDFGYNDLKL